MIRWDGATKEKNGLQFNVDVAKLFKAEFWCTELEVKLTKILNKKLIDYGDVDVLAWHKSKNIVLAIECKNLEIAKTNSEIARQLYEFRGEKNEKGKNVWLKKHMIRIEVLENDIGGLKSTLVCDTTNILN